jgi:hypothetical protein
MFHSMCDVLAVYRLKSIAVLKLMSLTPIFFLFSMFLINMSSNNETNADKKHS